MSDLGHLSFFLGIVSSHSNKVSSYLKHYLPNRFSRANMTTYNPRATPSNTKLKFSPKGNPVYETTLYHSLFGALQYLIFTRPDIAYAVQQICIFMYDPHEPHFHALKCILRYIRGTLSWPFYKTILF